MTTQNQILKLSSNKQFKLSNLGHKSGKYYFILLHELNVEPKVYKNYYIFVDLYELFQNYIKIINHIIYENLL